MNKILLIIEREYITRVRKKSFIIMSILGPILIAAIYAVPIWFATHGGEKKVIEVLDQSGIFASKFKSTDKLTFVTVSGDFETKKEVFKEGTSDALLYIPKLDMENPKGVTVISKKGVAMSTKSSIEHLIEDEIEAIKFKEKGIDKAVLETIKTSVSITTLDLNDKESNSTIATVIGMVAGIMIYFFIFMYGVQVMRGVIEEKTNRIVEIIISSVKPFELMMGKILGIAGVGLTQLLIWVILGFGVLSVIPSTLGIDQNTFQKQTEIPAQGQLIQQDQQQKELQEQLKKINPLAGLENVNFPLIIACFAFYFLFGYLMYAALFGAIGSAVDNETDSQQFMLPVTIPLIIAISMSGAVINEPNGAIAFWLSIFPLTSPVIMMIRVPFIGLSWELFLSMALLITCFVGTTWIAGKIYRVGILMYGKKITYKELSKWLFYK